MRPSYNFSFNVTEFTESTWNSLKKLLVQFYNSNEEFSGVTSSHWQKYGEYQHAELKSDESLELKGLGFGDYENRNNLTLLNYLINTPMTMASKIALLGVKKDLRILIKNLAVDSKRQLNPDFIRLAFVSQRLSEHIIKNTIKKVMIIGDGFGTLGSILSKVHPDLTVIQVNLGRTLIFDLAFSSITARNKLHLLIHELSGAKDGAINFLPAEDLSNSDEHIELFIAVSSFQEMDIQIVQNYFKLMRLQTGVISAYLVSRLAKTLPDGTEVRLDQYGWDVNDEIIFKRLSWYANWGVRRRPPFIFQMDGKMEERLVTLSK